MSTGKLTSRFALASAALLVLWVAFALWGAPGIIRGAYAGRSLPWLNSLIAGQGQHSVDYYLDAWTSLARLLTVFLIVGSGALYAAVRFRRSILGVAGKLVSELPEVGFGVVVQLAVAFGAVAGLTEVISGYLRVRGLPGAAFSWHTAYRTPMVAAGTLVLIALILGLAARVARRSTPLRVAPPLFGFLGVYSIVRSVELSLHAAAVAILSLGVAVQVVRIIARHPLGLRVFVRRSTVLTGAVIAVGAIAPDLWDRTVERRMLADLPDAPADAPNVLLIILDTVRARNLSLYGYERPTTPNLQELASGGVVFDRAVATAPWTLPSHASIFTGRYHHEHSADWTTPLDARHPTLAEVLAGKGYQTAGFTANRGFAGKRSGLDRGFARYEDHENSPSGWVASWWLSRTVAQWFRERVGDHRPWWKVRADEINGRFLGWLSRAEARPFFAFLNYMDAHQPYLPPAPFNLHFSDTQPRYWVDFVEGESAHTEEDLRELVEAYDSSLYYLDHQLGQLFDELERRGVLEHTLLIVTSDHGEEFGEHGPEFIQHGKSLYWPSLHVPLILRFPERVAAGERVARAVSLRDIPATVMDALGGSTAPFPGSSLVPSPGEPGVTGSTPLSQVTPGIRWPSRWRASQGAMRSIVSDNLHLILWPGEEEELFDVDVDPLELNDLSGRTEETLIGNLRARLAPAPER
jgi:arylsulfatase A-like enzyme